MSLREIVRTARIGHQTTRLLQQIEDKYVLPGHSKQEVPVKVMAQLLSPGIQQPRNLMQPDPPLPAIFRSVIAQQGYLKPADEKNLLALITGDTINEEPTQLSLLLDRLTGLKRRRFAIREIQLLTYKLIPIAIALRDADLWTTQWHNTWKAINIAITTIDLSGAAIPIGILTATLFAVIQAGITKTAVNGILKPSEMDKATKEIQEYLGNIGKTFPDIVLATLNELDRMFLGARNSMNLTPRNAEMLPNLPQTNKLQISDLFVHSTKAELKLQSSQLPSKDDFFAFDQRATNRLKYGGKTGDLSIAQLFVIFPTLTQHLHLAELSLNPHIVDQDARYITKRNVMIAEAQQFFWRQLYSKVEVACGVPVPLLVMAESEHIFPNYVKSFATDFNAALSPSLVLNTLQGLLNFSTYPPEHEQRGKAAKNNVVSLIDSWFHLYDEQRILSPEENRFLLYLINTIDYYIQMVPFYQGLYKHHPSIDIALNTAKDNLNLLHHDIIAKLKSKDIPIPEYFV